MLASTIVPPTNHLLRQNNWARQKLREHKHKTAQISLPPFTFCLTVLEGGEVATAAPDAAADALLSLDFPLLLRILAGDEAAASEVSVSGDAQFAADINTIARNLRYDAEEDLSRVVGDVAAHRIASAARDFVSWQKSLLGNFAQTTAEFLTFERPVLADAARVRGFIAEVDELKDAVARLEKRMEKLRARDAS
ncbi:MAG TPA: SCP2 sterol-binding domain-containing protein [Burkholderiales bacterium]|nr:SCP2 sterol-binding domain-containing protein [Burkholderiales bacterium]